MNSCLLLIASKTRTLPLESECFIYVLYVYKLELVLWICTIFKRAMATASAMA